MSGLNDDMILLATVESRENRKSLFTTQ